MGWEVESRRIPQILGEVRSWSNTRRLPSGLLRPMGWEWRVVVSHRFLVGLGLLDKRWCELGGFVGDVGLDGVLH
jgi:hypothetical protein